MMPKVKKQHYVPKFYLSRWTVEDNSEQVYVFNKDKSRQYKANIKDISSAKYFYDYPELQEEHKVNWIQKLKEDKSLTSEQINELVSFTEEQIIEQALGELESINAPIIDSIIKRLDGFKALPMHYFIKHHVLSYSDIVELSYYIATQYARTEETRITMEQITKLMVKHFSDFTLLNIDKLENDTELLEKMGKENFKSFSASVKSGKLQKILTL